MSNVVAIRGFDQSPMPNKTMTAPPKPKQNALERLIDHLINPPIKGRPTRVAGPFKVSKDGNKLTHWNSYEDVETLIAVRVNGVIIGNASILRHVECGSAWGSYQHNRRETRVQRLLQAKGVAMLPFNVFTEAKLDPSTIKVIAKAEAETVKRKVNKYDHRARKDITSIESVHFVGASVFKLGQAYFLFDIDRREAEHKIFNPFLVRLPKAVKTIDEAYQSLKPKEVIAAEKKGLSVLRQGEWFFIESKAPKFSKPSDVALLASIVGTLDSWRLERLTKEQKDAYARCQKFAGLVPRPQELRAGPNRPNEAQEVVQVGKTVYVRGKVSHSGREHADLQLLKWHIAVPNTATTSWTITGDID